jgi:hypothetical protein
MNEKEKSICRIDQWHRAGYTGKGIKIATKDISGLFPGLSFFHGKVKDPFRDWPPHFNSHVQQVADVLHQIAPDAEIYTLGHSTPEDLTFILENGIHLVNNSTTGSYNNPADNALENQAIERGTMFVGSAGNDGESGPGVNHTKETWLSVGAVHYMKSTLTGEMIINRPNYSSWGDDDLDCVGFSALTVHDAQGANPDGFTATGTSFSAPFVTGMLALYYQWFIEYHGRNPRFEETYSFVKANSMDLEVAGFDDKTGFGLFVLPEVEKMPKGKIELFVDQTKGFINGEPVELYIAPEIKKGRALVGLRDVSELLGCQVEWDEKTRKITIKK